MRSNASRSTTRSLMTGNESARQGSKSMTSPSENERICSWHVVVCSGPCAIPLITIPHIPQIPSRQSESNAMGSSPSTVPMRLCSTYIPEHDMFALKYGSAYIPLFAPRSRVICLYCQARVYDFTAEESEPCAHQAVTISDGPESPLS